MITSTDAAKDPCGDTRGLSPPPNDDDRLGAVITHGKEVEKKAESARKGAKCAKAEKENVMKAASEELASKALAKAKECEEDAKKSAKDAEKEFDVVCSNVQGISDPGTKDIAKRVARKAQMDMKAAKLSAKLAEKLAAEARTIFDSSGNKPKIDEGKS